MEFDSIEAVALKLERRNPFEDMLPGHSFKILAQYESKVPDADDMIDLCVVCFEIRFVYDMAVGTFLNHLSWIE
jgi:hypothetical protein